MFVKSRKELGITVMSMLALTLASNTFAHDDDDESKDAPPPTSMADIKVEAQDVAEGIYMLTGQGGNIGLSVGADATFIIDDQFAPLTDKIVDAIAQKTDRPVDYVLNTHWHFDHTGGNENFGKRGATIMAHDNVRKRMAEGLYMKAFDRQIDPAPEIALPMITFDNTLSLYVNGQDIRGIHVSNAHTDGDTIVHFRAANVMHLGDTFFNGLYPFIDLESGGSIDGMIASAAKVLTMTDDKTKIIPGHGPLSNAAELKSYHDTLKSIRDKVAAMIEAGDSLEAVVAAKPTAEFDATANRFGFLTPEQFVTTVYTSLKQ
ncbi:MAG: MBL fold metallo-hydrolase [Woeseiaceae bacterium]